MRATDSSWLRRVALWVWILGFTIGALSHLWDVVRFGSDAYVGYAEPVRVFWFSLVLIDPLVVALLGCRRRSGVALGVLTMVVDYVVDLTVSLPLPPNRMPGGLVRLTLFSLFVLGTTPLVWRLYSAESR